MLADYHPNKDGYESEGGWAVIRRLEIEDYTIVVRQWREQSPHYQHKKKEPDKMEADPASGATP